MFKHYFTRDLKYPCGKIRPIFLIRNLKLKKLRGLPKTIPVWNEASTQTFVFSFLIYIAWLFTDELWQSTLNRSFWCVCVCVCVCVFSYSLMSTLGKASKLKVGKLCFRLEKNITSYGLCGILPMIRIVSFSLCQDGVIGTTESSPRIYKTHLYRHWKTASTWPQNSILLKCQFSSKLINTIPIKTPAA